LDRGVRQIEQRAVAAGGFWRFGFGGGGAHLNLRKSTPNPMQGSGRKWLPAVGRMSGRGLTTHRPLKSFPF
ncbi:MAG: hypothetical protein ACXWKO_10570, partial [Phenylobacterium sp.]